jgi:hypothetical protein
MVEISDSARVWITPGTSAVAFSAQVSPFSGGGSSFPPIERAVSHGLWGLTESRDGTRRLWALLPDGNSTVRVDHADGHSTIFPTVENAFVIDIEGVRAIRFTDAKGIPREQLC